MSAYNAENHVTEAIESILNQTFTQFEFIIVNDGSIDNTKSIVLQFSDQRIIFVDNIKNIGLAASLNKAIKLAKGKYIARMDADDISDKHRLQKQFNVLESNHNFNVCVTPIKLFGIENSISGFGNV